MPNHQYWGKEADTTAIIEAVEDAIISMNLDAMVQSWNSSAERIFGYTAEIMIGRSATLLIPPELVNQERDLFKRVCSGAKISSHETVRVAQDGRKIFVTLTISPIKNGNDKIIGVLAVARDITSQRDAERNAAHLAAIVESADDAIASKNLDGIVQSWNKSAERIFGYSAEEMIGQSISLLIPPDRLDEEPKILARISLGERVEHYETIRISKAGQRIPVSLTISPIKDKRGVIVGASKVARDITERKNTEKALKQADRRKDEFLAILAHELRNPLAPIRTGLDIIEMNLTEPGARERAMRIVNRQFTHLTRIIDDLLELARIVSGKIVLKKGLANLKDIVADAVEANRQLIETRSHELRVELPAQAIYLDVDAVRIAQVISNLLTNAAKYTDSSGCIVIGADIEDETLVLRVEDSGRGIEPELLSKIFDQFVQGRNDYARSEGGLGVGLSIARRLAELHGGSVNAYSEGRGKGSKFVLRLPLARHIGNAAYVSSKKPDIASTKPRRVLVVDDNRDVTDSIAELLELKGHAVQRHYEGDGVVEIVKSFRPDVVILDLGLPGQDGFAVARQLRTQLELPHLRLIAISGYGRAMDIERAHAAGIDVHLLKPVSASSLIKVIEEESAG